LQDGAVPEKSNKYESEKIKYAIAIDWTEVMDNLESPVSNAKITVLAVNCFVWTGRSGGNPRALKPASPPLVWPFSGLVPDYSCAPPMVVGRSFSRNGRDFLWWCPECHCGPLHVALVWRVPWVDPLER
jgi:hypothetical protein